jgi:hypothetical protein
MEDSEYSAEQTNQIDEQEEKSKFIEDINVEIWHHNSLCIGNDNFNNICIVMPTHLT